MSFKEIYSLGKPINDNLFFYKIYLMVKNLLIKDELVWKDKPVEWLILKDKQVSLPKHGEKIRQFYFISYNHLCTNNLRIIIYILKS